MMIGTPRAFAQGGPLTGSLGEGPPTVTSTHIGPVQLNPTFALKELGVDNNVFDDAVDPKKDYMLVFSSNINAYVRSGFIQFVGATGSDFTFYSKYKSERSAARQLRGRIDFLLSRFRPSLGGALVDSHTRPNAEIDLRAKRSEKEATASVMFEVSPLVRVFVGASRVDTRYNEGQRIEDIDLAKALNRRGETARAGVRIIATPFTTVQVEGSSGRDTFVSAPERNSQIRNVNMSVNFGNDAIVRGSARVGVTDFNPNDPTVERFRGVVTDVNLTYVSFWRARLNLQATRDVNYSFEQAAGYFVGNAYVVNYNQRLFGPIDAEVSASRGILSYSETLTQPARRDYSNQYAAGVGYNRNNGSRLGITYEYAERDSQDRPDRHYTRRRIFGSVTYTF